MERATSLIGYFVLVALAAALSTDRRAIRWRPVAWGLGLQFVLAVALLGAPAFGVEFRPVRAAFEWFGRGFDALLAWAAEGSGFVFGPLANMDGFGFIFAFQVLPTIVFLSSVTAVLYHLGWMQKALRVFAKLMRRTSGTSGAETMSTAANVFLGQTEAPLAIKPYLARMTRSELFCVMVGGMANTAGGILGGYVLFLRDRFPDIAGHLLVASILSAPAALAVSKIMVPETEVPETLGEDRLEEAASIDANTIDAAARGASEGVSLALNVAGALIAFIALVAMLNAMLGTLGEMAGFHRWGGPFLPGGVVADVEPRLTMDVILGWLFAPIAFLMGVPFADCARAGALLGEKIVLNEFVAYAHLGAVGGAITDRTALILSYALCGFANFGSIAVQVGGLGAMAPERRGDLARMGLRAVAGGSICTCLLGATAGFLL